MGKDKGKLDITTPPVVVSLTGRGHRQKGAGTVITAKAPIVTNDGIVLKAHERLPVQLLSEYCQKEKRPMPKYIPQHPKFRYKVILEDSKNSKNDLEFLPNQSVESDKVARDYAALLALWHFQRTLPLERKIPEPYSTSWIQMLNAEKEEKNKAGNKDTKGAKEKQSVTVPIPSTLAVKTNATNEVNTVFVPTIDEATADWLCEKCGNQNYATLASGVKREKCFKCQTIKTDNCVLVASTNPNANVNSSNSNNNNKGVQKKNEVATKEKSSNISNNNNNNNINDTVPVKRKVPPSAVMNLKSVETFASKAEQEKHNQEKLLNRRKKSSFFEALIKANRPSPVYLSPKMKKLLEDALGLGLTDNSKSAINDIEVPELSDLLKVINETGIINDEVNVPINIQIEAVKSIISLLHGQGFSDHSISQTLAAIRKSPEIVVDELDQGQEVDSELFTSTLQKTCLEYICLYTDDSSLPEAFGSKPNESKRNFAVFNPNSNKGQTQNVEGLSLLNYGWTQKDYEMATSLINKNSHLIMTGFLLSHISFKLIEESGNLFPSAFIDELLSNGITTASDHKQEDTILSEIEMLTAMYPDRFTYNKIEIDSSSSYMHHLALNLPRIDGIPSKSSGTLDVFIHNMINYPEEVPLILVNIKSGLDADLLLHLQYLVWKKALTSFAGDVMVFQIASFIELELGELLSSITPIALAISLTLRKLQDNPKLDLVFNTLKVADDENESISLSEGMTTAATSDGFSETSSVALNKKKTKNNHPFWIRIKNDSMRPSFMKNNAIYQQILEKRRKLPSYLERDNFLTMLRGNRCIVVTGETGCGKTTQCPSFIYEENPKAKIVVCQPRRLAAVSVATRVAEELACTIGEDVGYMVKGDSKATNSTRIVFCTYGVILRRLQDDPDLQAVDYVVLDEIHERGIESDFTLALLMSALSRRNNLKLILMSATISTDKFADYLGQSLNIPPAPILSVPGQTFPVTQYYKKDYEEIVRNRPLNQFKDDNDYDDEYEEVQEHMIGGKQRKGDIDYDLMVRLIMCLAEGYDGNGGMLERAQGSILVFMPGVAEISKLIRLLTTTFNESNSAFSPNIMPLHGNLSPQEQRKVFESSSKLKIVVATNVAEASVTITDVTVIIDSCRVKEMDFDSERQTSALLMKMASQNSMRQRKGRAGRVQKGRCFRIINETAFEKLPVNTVPEMLRSPLDNLILQVKAMNLKENCVQLLSRCPDPPMLSAIEAAIENLIKIQALDKSETLTPLGRHISYLPCDPSIGKLLIYGSLLGSLFHASSIAACITNRSPFQNFSSNEMKPFEEFSKKQFDGNIISDYTVMSATMLTYNETKNKRGFCKSYGLSFDRLREISESQHDLLEGLVSVGFIDAVSDGLRADSPYNQNIRSARIVSAVMSASLYPRVCKILRPPKRFVETLGGNLERSVEAIELKFYLPEKNDSFDNKTSTLINEKFKQKNIDIATEEMTRVFVHPTSICFSNSSYNSSNFVIFGDKQLSINTQKESKIYLRNVSEVGPYALLLFGGKLEAQYLEGTITIDNWIRFSAPGKIVAMIQLLRKRLDELLEEKINNTDINIINSKVLDAACKLLATDGLHT